MGQPQAVSWKARKSQPMGSAISLRGGTPSGAGPWRPEVLSLGQNARQETGFGTHEGSNPCQTLNLKIALQILRFQSGDFDSQKGNLA